MKKSNLLLLCLFIASCGKQTAPPMDIQNTEKTMVENQVDRVDMPEATFAATPVPNDEINRGPSPTPEPETNALVSGSGVGDGPRLISSLGTGVAAKVASGISTRST